MADSNQIFYLIITKYENIKALTTDPCLAKNFVETVGIEDCIVFKRTKDQLKLREDEIEYYKLQDINYDFSISNYLEELLEPFIMELIDQFSGLCEDLLSITEYYKIDRERDEFLTLSYYSDPYMYIEFCSFEEIFESRKIFKMYLKTLKRTIP